MDGLLLPEHAGYRRHPRRPRSGLRGGRLQVPRELHLDHLRDGQGRRAPGRHVGRAGRVLLRRPPAAGRRGIPPQGPFHGRAPATVREHGLRGGLGEAPPEADGADRALPEAPPRSARPRGSDVEGFIATPGAGSSRPSPNRSSSASSATCSTRTSSSLPTASAPFRASTSRTRLSSTWRPGASRPVPPAESNTGMFGGNSNWRGPIWMPVNALIVRGLLNLYGFYGDDFKVECPTGSGNRMTCSRSRRRSPGVSRACSCATRAAAGRSTVARRSSGGPALARPDPLLRVLPRRHRGGPRGQSPDGLDGPRRAPHGHLRALHRQGRAGDTQGEARGQVGPAAGRRGGVLRC